MGAIIVYAVISLVIIVVGSISIDWIVYRRRQAGMWCSKCGAAYCGCRE